MEGKPAVALLEQFKAIREALDLIEARLRESVAANPDALPGYGLAPGAQVRETFRVSALKVWLAINRAPQNLPLNVRDVLSCCRINWAELVQQLAAAEGVEPKLASDQLDQILDGIFPVRTNKPSLRRLNTEEALAQAESLAERSEQ